MKFVVGLTIQSNHVYHMESLNNTSRNPVKLTKTHNFHKSNTNEKFFHWSKIWSNSSAAFADEFDFHLPKSGTNSKVWLLDEAYAKAERVLSKLVQKLERGQKKPNCTREIHVFKFICGAGHHSKRGPDGRICLQAV